MKYFCLLILTIQCSLITMLAQEPAEQISWGNLEKGEYDVGYQVFAEYDQSRTVRSKFNYKGEPIIDNNYRPVQISVWYPAEPGRDDTTMPYSAYIITRGSRFDYSLLNEAGTRQILDRYRRSINFYNQTENKNQSLIDYVISRQSHAYENARPSKGKFPLILFCSGGGDSPDSFDVLFEFLASYGYVVAAIPSNGMFEKAPSYNLMDEEAQTRDMEFTMNFMREFPSTDLNKVCSMGYSYGGLINVLFALRNFDIQAVLCLDGSICLKDRDRAVKSLPYFDAGRLKIPFLNMARQTHEEQDFGFYSRLMYSDAYLLHFKQMNHQDFNSVPHIEDFANIESENNKNITQIGSDNALVYLYALNFLDAYLKKDSAALSYMQASPEQNGIADSLLALDFKKGLWIPPTGEDFINYIESEGIEKGMEIYWRARANDSTILMFDKNEINNLGYSFLNEGLIQDAIEVFKLFVLEYPGISNSYDSLGEAYAKNNDIEEALINYRIALKINPYSQSAARAIKKLENLPF